MSDVAQSRFTSALPRPRLPERELPSRAAHLLFRAKVAAFQARRLLRDLARPLPRLAPGALEGAFVIARSVTPLWPDLRPQEAANQRGKVHNLRAAARRLDGLLIPAGATFSFWRQVGRATARRGFATGRMLQQGCLVPAVGGGLCQLSNALYDVALTAGTEIVERHAHSRLVPGSAAAFGRDATVAWNYVDLRFRARQAMRLEVRLERKRLVVRLLAREAAEATPAEGAGPAEPAIASSCATCGETACFRSEAQLAATRGRTAFLLDEAWPEFRAFVAAARKDGDVLGIPLDGARWGRPAYAWPTEGFAALRTATLATLARALAARRLARAGGARVAAQFRGAARLAARLAPLLDADATEVVVSQSLLPVLWQAGHLGGRGVTVLMTRPPLAEIHARLDAAAAAHPERASLADFRAPGWMVAAEAAALAAAERIVTPNAAVAALFGGRATLLDWRQPSTRPVAPAMSAQRIAFPGPAIARKGAHAVRDAARALDLEVLLLGRDLEGEDFWRGVRVRRVAAGDRAWLADVAAVVQPAIVEERPAALLAARAAGVPVVASAACGLAPGAGVTLVEADEPAQLIRALQGLGLGHRG